MKKRAFILILLLMVLGVLIYFSLNLIENRGQSAATINDYAIKDTAAVDRIKITMSNGFKIDVVRGKGNWTTKDGRCIQQEPIHNMLHTFSNIAIKSFIPEDAVQNIRERISINYRKVEIFQHGEWVKTWYVGSSTPNRYGTYAILETAEHGEYKTPNILEMKGMHGNIVPRFFADYRKWSCTGIFSAPKELIQKITFHNFEDSTKNFKIVRTGKESFQLFFNHKKVDQYNAVRLDQYLREYKNVHFNMPNYLLNKTQVDSVRNARPYYKISLTTTKGKTTSVITHKIKLNEPDYDILGTPTYYDINNMWAFLDNGKIVKVQYFVFDKLAVGYDFFTLSGK